MLAVIKIILDALKQNTFNLELSKKMYDYCKELNEYLKKTNSKFVGHVPVIRFENESNILEEEIDQSQMEIEETPTSSNNGEEEAQRNRCRTTTQIQHH